MDYKNINSTIYLPTDNNHFADALFDKYHTPSKPVALPPSKTFPKGFTYTPDFPEHYILDGYTYIDICNFIRCFILNEKIYIPGINMFKNYFTPYKDEINEIIPDIDLGVNDDFVLLLSKMNFKRGTSENFAIIEHIIEHFNNIDIDGKDGFELLDEYYLKAKSNGNTSEAPSSEDIGELSEVVRYIKCQNIGTILQNYNLGQYDITRLLKEKSMEYINSQRAVSDLYDYIREYFLLYADSKELNLCLGYFFNSIHDTKQYFQNSLYNCVSKQTRQDSDTIKKYIGKKFISMPPFMSLFLQRCKNKEDAPSILMQMRNEFSDLRKHNTLFEKTLLDTVSLDEKIEVIRSFEDDWGKLTNRICRRSEPVLSWRFFSTISMDLLKSGIDIISYFNQANIRRQFFARTKQYSLLYKEVLESSADNKLITSYFGEPNYNTFEDVNKYQNQVIL